MTEGLPIDLHNPAKKWLVWLAFLVALTLLCVVALVYALSGVEMVLLAGWIAPAVPIVTVLYKEYLRRPVTVRIEDWGFVMRFRHTSDRLVRWEQVGGVYRERGDLSTPRGRRTRSGGVRLKGESFPYPITYEIADSLWMTYSEQTGTLPPIWDGE
jgi:hypothetical protein